MEENKILIWIFRQELMHKSMLAQSRKTNFQVDNQDIFLNIKEQPDNTYAAQDFDIQIDSMYMEKIKKQRQTIEAITKNYELQKSELQQAQKTIQQLQKKIEILNQQAAFKKKYDELFKEQKAAEYQLEKYKFENQSLKKQIFIMTKQKQMIIKNIRQASSDQSYKCTQQILLLKQDIDNKQKSIDKLKNKYQQAIRKMNEQNIKKQNTFESLKEQMNCDIQNLKNQVQKLKKSIQNKMIQNSHINDQLTEEKNITSQLRQNIQKKQKQFQQIQIKNSKLFQKLKFHIRALNKQLLDKQEQIHTKNTNIIVLDQKLKNKQRETQQLNIDFKQKTKKNQDEISKLNFQWQQQRRRWTDSTKGLKQTIQDLLRTKTQAKQQNEKLSDILKQKQNIDKVKGEIKRKEFCQIDRVQRIVKRI